MILPIVAYGDPVLKRKAKEITKDYPNFDTLLQSMFETMYNAAGVGLAAPQIGLPIRMHIGNRDFLRQHLFQKMKILQMKKKSC